MTSWSPLDGGDRRWCAWWNQEQKMESNDLQSTGWLMVLLWCELHLNMYAQKLDQKEPQDWKLCPRQQFDNLFKNNWFRLCSRSEAPFVFSLFLDKKDPISTFWPPIPLLMTHQNQNLNVEEKKKHQHNNNVKLRHRLYPLRHLRRSTLSPWRLRRRRPQRQGCWRKRKMKRSELTKK